MAMTPDNILALGRKFMESRIFLSAAELDLFTLLAKEPLDAGEVAAKLQVTLRGITVLLDAVVSMGLLEKKDGKYSCTQETASLLSKESPANIMPMVMHSAHLWQRWSSLTKIVRSGIEKKRPSIFESSESEQEAFIGAMHTVARRVAPDVVKAVDPANAASLLDIGCASGSYSQAFLEAYPSLKATLFDLPPVIRIARHRLEGSGLLDRVTFVPGDFYEDELPAGHDFALLSAIIHQNSTEENIVLYRKIYRALVPGGRLVIRDHVMSPDHTSPAIGAFFAVNMLVGTPGGGTYTFDEIRESMEAAGFVNIRLIQQDERMNGLVEGFRP